VNDERRGRTGATIFCRQAMSLIGTILLSSCVSPHAGTLTPLDGATAQDGPDAGTGSDSGPTGGAPGADASAGPAGLNAAPGTLGGGCTQDAECPAGLKCLAPSAFPHATKYCAPTCNSNDDCQRFGASSYTIHVPLDPDGLGNNVWNSTILSRAYSCSATPGGTQKYCQFLCPENTAATADFSECPCLPRHAVVKDAEGNALRCDFDDKSASGCSIINYPGRRNVCDACNSKPVVPGCYTGDYVCSMNRNFNGSCVHGLGGNSVASCLSAQTNDCDSTCYQNCASGSEVTVGISNSCVNLCCHPTGRPASVPPQCGGGPADGGMGMGDSSGPIDGAVAAGDGSVLALDTAVPPDARPPACVDIPVPLGTNLQVLAAAGMAPAPTGGAIVDGYYVATAIKVYGTPQSPGTPAGTFGGDAKFDHARFEVAFSSSAIQGTYFASGTYAVASPGTASASYDCASDNMLKASFGFSVTGPSTIDLIAPFGGYVTVTTYTRQ
jgi:hypothetical protein